MRQLFFLIILTLTSVRLFCQSSVGVPHFILPWQSNIWQVIDPGKVQLADGEFVESKLLKAIQPTLYFRSFGFAIPSNALISGIDVRVTRKKKGPNDVKDVTVALLRPINDTEAIGKGPNLAQTTPWTETLSTILYSFPKDAFDANGPFLWTPADVNKPAFGLLFGTSVGMGKGVYLLFDKVELTVKYTSGNTTRTQSSTIESSTSPYIKLKQLGKRFQVETEKDGKYLFTVRDRNGTLLQQTSFIAVGSSSTILTLEDKCKGYCIVTVEGNGTKKSISIVAQ